MYKHNDSWFYNNGLIAQYFHSIVLRVHFCPTEIKETTCNLGTKDFQISIFRNRIGGKMVSVLASSAGDRGLKPWSGQTKDFKIGICCFSAKHAALRRKSKDWLAWNQNNVSEWSDMSSRKLLFQ
jgi:hypothetical protein